MVLKFLAATLAFSTLFASPVLSAPISSAYTYSYEWQGGNSSYGLTFGPPEVMGEVHIRVTTDAAIDFASLNLEDAYIYSLVFQTRADSSRRANKVVAGSVWNELRFDQSPLPFLNGIGIAIEPAGQFTNASFVRLEVEYVPEPATLSLLGLGLLAIGVRRGRRA